MKMPLFTCLQIILLLAVTTMEGLCSNDKGKEWKSSDLSKTKIELGKITDVNLEYVLQRITGYALRSSVLIHTEILQARGNHDSVILKPAELPAAGTYALDDLLGKFTKVVPGLTWKVDGSSVNITVIRVKNVQNLLDLTIGKEANWNGSFDELKTFLNQNCPTLGIHFQNVNPPGSGPNVSFQINKAMTARQILNRFCEQSHMRWTATVFDAPAKWPVGDPASHRTIDAPMVQIFFFGN